MPSCLLHAILPCRGLNQKHRHSWQLPSRNPVIVQSQAGPCLKRIQALSVGSMMLGCAFLWPSCMCKLPQQKSRHSLLSSCLRVAARCKSQLPYTSDSITPFSGTYLRHFVKKRVPRNFCPRKSLCRAALYDKNDTVCTSVKYSSHELETLSKSTLQYELASTRDGKRSMPRWHYCAVIASQQVAGTSPTQPGETPLVSRLWSRA